MDTDTEKKMFHQHYEVVLPQARERLLENIVRAFALAPPASLVYRITGRSRDGLDFVAAGQWSAIRGMSWGRIRLEEHSSGETRISCKLSFFHRGLFLAFLCGGVALGGLLYTILDSGSRNPMIYLALVLAVCLPVTFYWLSKKCTVHHFKAFLHNLQYLG